MNVFLIYNIEKAVEQYKIWDEVVFWFTQFTYYNVYLPLLIQ